MNIIFLDVDGVLVHQEYTNKYTYDIDIDKVELVKKICNKTDAKVVISSSWRGNDKETPEIYYKLIEILSDNDIEVIDKTPYLVDCERVEEVFQWIENNKVTNFVILDDEDFNWSNYGYDKYWVETSWYGGIQQEHVDKAIKILSDK